MKRPLPALLTIVTLATLAALAAPAKSAARATLGARTASASRGEPIPHARNADVYPRNWDVDILHYAFHLTLSDTTDEIAGDAEITIRFVKAGIDEFALDLIGVADDGDTGMTVSAIRRGGKSIAYTHADDRLVVGMTTPSAAEERRTYWIAYHGVPEDGLVIDKNKYGDRTFFGDNYPERARYWLPTVDHVSDKATVEWLITAPNHYQVVATGSLVERTDLADDMRLTHWRSMVPISPKIMVIGVARFAMQQAAVVDGVPVQTWVYPQNRDEGFYDYALAEKVLRFFDGHIGEFPYAKLANVQSKTRYGGMENASNIFYSEGSVSGERRGEGLIAHEVAHQWFGDSVTERDWHHNWLSEGFATYFTQLYNEFTFGRDRLVQGMRGARDTVARFYASNPELPLIAESVSDPNELLNRNAYQKGAWVLHMLRRQIGDEAFWTGIHNYYAEYRDRTALTEDLQRVMEEASGQDLEWFFAQWAYVPGHPMLDVAWSHDAAAGRLKVRIEQTQDALFRFPLDIGIRDESGEVRIVTSQVSERSVDLELEAGTAPADVVLDPNVWLLFEGHISR